VNLLAGNVELFNVVLVRFDEASDIATLTTGRSDLWASYTEYLIQNPFVLLFGSGFGAPLINGHGAHNTYLDLLYYLGIVGTVILLAYFASVFKILPKPKQRKFLNYGIWIGIFIMYAFLSELFYFDWVVHIILAVLLFQSDVLLDFSAREKEGVE
jgi:O-antigen ligase